VRLALKGLRKTGGDVRRADAGDVPGRIDGRTVDNIHLNPLKQLANLRKSKIRKRDHARQGGGEVRMFQNHIQQRQLRRAAAGLKILFLRRQLGFRGFLAQGGALRPLLLAHLLPQHRLLQLQLFCQIADVKRLLQRVGHFGDRGQQIAHRRRL